MKYLFLAGAAALGCAGAPVWAQDHEGHDMSAMPGMADAKAEPAPKPAAEPEPEVDHSKMHHGPPPPRQSLIGRSTYSGGVIFDLPGEDGDPGGGGSIGGMKIADIAEGSGTSRLPGHEGMMTGLHLATGDWMVMAHGFAWGVYTDQGGARGDSGAYVQSMAMLSATRELGGARLQARTMLSLEPLMGARGYPNLFATGETANGIPLVDRQHPHDFFMELAARLDVDLGRDTGLFLYGGPVAEPALGPSAFMHRSSARYNPDAPITHHWFDSTHITYGVVTAGLYGKTWQIEGSAFRGREPDEDRWGIETPKLDSWSVRATLTPSPNWALQVSHGRLKEPEAMHAGQDEARTTASAHYADGGGLSAMLAFSAKNRMPGATRTAWLAEANWDVTERHSIFGRIENVANDELFPDHDDSLHDQPFRVTKLEAGYAWRVALTDDLGVALGGTVSGFLKPAALDAVYGKAPMGFTLFARLALGR